MDSHLDYLLSENERAEMKSEFYERYGITYDEYLEDLEYQYCDQYEER